MFLQDEGYSEMESLVGFYKENAQILRETFRQMGFSVYGGDNAPYIWIGFPGQASWDVFANILEKCHIVTTPGSGFGQAGEGFVRVSAFGHRQVLQDIGFSHISALKVELITLFQESFNSKGISLSMACGLVYLCQSWGGMLHYHFANFSWPENDYQHFTHACNSLILEMKPP